MSISPSASTNEVKVAYHAALLRNHPDKRPDVLGRAVANADTIDIDLLKQAYITLSSSDSRASYDANLARRPQGPRPAQVVSLEEFTEVDIPFDNSHFPSTGITWTYKCRCGGKYTITEKEMEDDRHLVGCNSCSEVVWVGYQVVEDDEDPAVDV